MAVTSKTLFLIFSFRATFLVSNIVVIIVQHTLNQDFILGNDTRVTYIEDKASSLLVVIFRSIGCLCHDCHHLGSSRSVLESCSSQL